MILRPALDCLQCQQQFFVAAFPLSRDRLPTGAWLRGKIGVLNKGFQTTRFLRILSQLLRGIMDQGGFDQGHVSSTHMKCHQTSSSLSHATPKFNRLQCFN